MKTKTKKPPLEAAPTIRFADLALPVEPAKPCGDDLEYDPEFVVLQAKAAPRESAQYGDFVAPVEPLNWTDLERDCRRLLLRTKDIRLLTLFLRCRTRMEQAEGLRDGLALLHALLMSFAGQLHPQLEVDGEPDPALRANALAALTDPLGLLADVREITVGGNNAMRLQIRDIERALAVPRPADALAADSVRQQLEACRSQGMPQIVVMDEACALARSIQRWCENSLQSDAPDLAPLTRLLQLVGNPDLAWPVGEPVATADNSSAAATTLSTLASATTRISTQPEPAGNCDEMPTDRHAALMQIRAAREWFEHHEPSSPVPLLLQQAEHLVGKPFAEVFQAIPADLVERWAQESA
ncbi:type VI secretion system protein TssA [Pandoraea sp. NPDC090278]|uniref:type VI secretion system protein TssA n=1 Tax=Pandoraea sp. NPDC090278 TaxID=3364391 RepID=UPI00383AA5F9